VLAAAAVALSLACAFGPAGASAAGPAYDDWSPDFPGFPSNTEVSARGKCAGGSDLCIDRTIGEMWRRFHTVIPACDANAIFSLTYLRVTEDVRTGVGEEFWPDHWWINYQDSIFARVYFDTYDNWAAGRRDLVPESWRIAFDAGRDEDVQGLGNLLLSMNAHVNRDFPFILYHAGLVRPDGKSRKVEHDGFGTRLRALYKPMLTELANRFDASMDDYDIPGIVADDDTLYSLLTQWRERAWQNAKKLAAAKTDAERREVAAGIEDEANVWANLIYNGAKYPPGTEAAAQATRDARCAAHGGQKPGYARGADVARSGRVAQLRGNRLSFTVSCPDGPGPCAGKVRVRLPGARGAEGEPLLVDARAFHVGRGQSKRYSIRLGGEEAAVLRHHDGRRGVFVGIRSWQAPGIGLTSRPKLELET